MGDLTIPAAVEGLVVFAHGSGSRFSRRIRSVAQVLQRGRYANLQLDLLTREEDLPEQLDGLAPAEWSGSERRTEPTARLTAAAHPTAQNGS